MEQTIFEAAGGLPAFLDLAAAWHARCLADPVLAHPFEHGYHPDHTERLARYWAEALGGPADYSESIGDESSVVRTHSGNGEHRDMDERGIAAFVAAMDDAGLPADPRLRDSLESYFRWGIDVMNSYPDSADDVPADLPPARWSWDGPM